MKRQIGFLLLLLGLFSLCTAGAGPAEHSARCRVFVDQEEISVLETAVCEVRTWSAEPDLTTTPVAILVHTFPCQVTVQFPDTELTDVCIRPLSLGIRPEISGQTVAFPLTGPAQLSIEYNGQYHGALLLFADEPDAGRPTEDQKKVRYFGPGVHKDQIITVRSHETIYLDEGCILYGQIYCGLGSDFTIAGHGILSGSIYDRYKDTIVPVNLSNCSDFTIRDITILDPSAWTVNLLKCKNGRIENVKIISARSNSDGFTFQNCSHIRVSNCFVRSWDDSLVIKGYGGDTQDICFDHCILWTDLAQSCEIGYETHARTIEDIVFRDITVLHSFHKPVISIHNSDHAAVRHVLYENITVEDAQMGEGDGTPYLIDLSTDPSQWSSTLQRGTIEDVEIRNVRVLSGKRPGIRISSYDETSRIDHVTISGLWLLGEKILSWDQVDYVSSPFNGDHIELLPGA